MEPELEKTIQECLLKVHVPQPYDKVYKDECMFSFATPLSEGGLYLNLRTLQAYSEEFLETDFNRNNFPLYLHETHTKVRS